MWKRSAPAAAFTPAIQEFTAQITENNQKLPEHRLPSRPTVGQRVIVQGDIKGAEDLFVEGRIEGRIDCPGACVTICGTGSVFGDIRARTVQIEGELTGNIFAEERARVCRTGTLIGDVTAPSVIIEDGAKLRGLVDVEPTRLDPSLALIPEIVKDLKSPRDKVAGLHLVTHRCESTAGAGT